MDKKHNKAVNTGRNRYCFRPKQICFAELSYLLIPLYRFLMRRFASLSSKVKENKIALEMLKNVGLSNVNTIIKTLLTEENHTGKFILRLSFRKDTDDLEKAGKFIQKLAEIWKKGVAYE
jgi:hypothetical protein